MFDSSLPSISSGIDPSVEKVLYSLGVPVMGISSGSVAPNGAISGFTALPFVFANAFCYFPPNILATVHPGGFAFCQFSAINAGVAFLNLLNTWPPTIPSVLVPVVDGRGAYTGDLTEEFLPGIVIPAFQGRSVLECEAAMMNNNSAGTKTLRHRLSGQGGTSFGALAQTTGTNSNTRFKLANQGETGKQRMQGRTLNNAGAAFAMTPLEGTIDTSVPSSLVLSLLRNTATDNIIAYSADGRHDFA